MISVAVLIHLQRRLSTSPRLPRATSKKLLVLLPDQWDNEVMSKANALSRSLIYGRALSRSTICGRVIKSKRRQH